MLKRVIISSTALGGRLSLLKQMSPATSSLGIRLPVLYNPFSLCPPPPHQFILISVSHVLVDLHDLSTISFLVIRFHPFALHGPPTSVYWILLRSPCLVHCKAVPVLSTHCPPSYIRQNNLRRIFLSKILSLRSSFCRVETCSIVIICEIIVNLLFIAQNNSIRF